MYTFKGKILKIHDETPDVKTFTVETPDEFSFEAGQACTIGIVGHSEIEHLKRPMTISSSPITQGKIDFTVKKMGIFTNELFKLHVGSHMEVRGPFGRHTSTELPPHSKLLFLAGGSGVTPFMSYIRTAINKELKTHIILIYSNKTQEDIIFQKEIDRINATSKTIKIINTITRESPSWKGERGRITQDLILKHVHNPQQYEWHMCGPGSMVQGIKEIMQSLHISENKSNEIYHG